MSLPSQNKSEQFFMINNTGKQRRVSESEREACREGVREVRLGRGGVSEREIDMNMHYKQLKRAAIFSAGPRATNGLHEERCRSAGECGRNGRAARGSGEGKGKLGDWRLVQTNKSLQIYFSAMRSAKLLRHAWAVSARETETATEQQQRERGEGGQGSDSCADATWPRWNRCAGEKCALSTR